MDETTTIAGIKIYNASLSTLISAIKTLLDSSKPTIATILTANPEIVIQAQDDTKLRNILNKSWATIPDGMGILWGARMQKKFIAERITGVRLTQELIDVAKKEKFTVGVIGGSEEASLKYRQYLKHVLPNSWTLPGPWIDTTDFYETKNELIDWCASSDGHEFLDELKNTSILFVAMGAPKQEFFIDYLVNLIKHKKIPTKHLIMVAVGGTFDELTGLVPKTPDWTSNVGLKWLHRLTIEPHRFKRQTRLFRFIRLVTSTGY